MWHWDQWLAGSSAPWRFWGWTVQVWVQVPAWGPCPSEQGPSSARPGTATAQPAYLETTGLGWGGIGRQMHHHTLGSGGWPAPYPNLGRPDSGSGALRGLDWAFGNVGT